MSSSEFIVTKSSSSSLYFIRSGFGVCFPHSLIFRSIRSSSCEYLIVDGTMIRKLSSM